MAPLATGILSYLFSICIAVKCQDWMDKEGWIWGAGAKIFSVRFCEKFGIKASGEASDRTNAH